MRPELEKIGASRGGNPSETGSTLIEGGFLHDIGISSHIIIARPIFSFLFSISSLFTHFSLSSRQRVYLIFPEGGNCVITNYMKTLKVMGIVGIVLSSLSFICIVAYQYSSPKAALGWGIYSTVYLIAYSIVGVVQAAKHRS